MEPEDSVREDSGTGENPAHLEADNDREEEGEEEHVDWWEDEEVMDWAGVNHPLGKIDCISDPTLLCRVDMRDLPPIARLPAMQLTKVAARVELPTRPRKGRSRDKEEKAHREPGIPCDLRQSGLF